MTGIAPRSPAQRGIPDLNQRIARLEIYESTQKVEPMTFETIVGAAAYAEYWKRMDESIDFLRDCYEYAIELRVKIAKARADSDPPPGADEGNATQC